MCIDCYVVSLQRLICHFLKYLCIMELELNYQDFVKYYRSQDFLRGLKNYFIDTWSNDGYLTIRFMDRHSTNPHSPILEENGTEKSSYFAIIFYYVSLCNYAINEVAGMDTLINFLKSTGWPMTSCGLGGIMSPNHTLKEAELIYENTSTLFQEVIPFMKEELNKFFNGGADNLNQIAYDEFVKAMEGKIDKFWEIADKEIEAFTFHK